MSFSKAPFALLIVCRKKLLFSMVFLSFSGLAGCLSVMNYVSFTPIILPIPNFEYPSNAGVSVEEIVLLIRSILH